ncbi:Cof-type HAD-IIB family hydrolase [Puniceicoccus vermicola]|uniref:HAD family phosphatase n=1 Tax=Puniceicoccus vermicola TaxID=388746 RepID=A0A7X1E5B9_9BACT|nr:HAD family hydrolase [Puniceicoccus vermicola]MBC2602868.1 HAD family phosphatase [Puniceicoccus vermicola]
MSTKNPKHTVRLAAIDLDGTLLGPDLTISPTNRRALESLAEEGIEVVLASGRHYQSMHPFVESLPMVRWVISAQGGELCSRDREEIVHRNFIHPGELQRIARERECYGISSVCYTAEGTITHMEMDSHIQSYSDLEGLVPKQVSANALLGEDILKVIWIGESSLIDQILLDHRAQAHESQIVQTFSTMCEFMPHTTSKGAALSQLSKRLGIDPGAAVVFGDGENDIPMFEWAGISYAMPHGWERARKKATHTAPEGSREDALARAIDDYRLRYRD